MYQDYLLHNNHTHGVNSKLEDFLSLVKVRQSRNKYVGENIYKKNIYT